MPEPIRRAISWIQLSGGRRIDAALAICPECKTLDLKTDFDTSTEPWVLTCPLGHKWTVTPTEANVERTN